MSKQTQRLSRRLEAIPKAVKKSVEPALVKAGNDLAVMMRVLAPRDTGALQESIEVTGPGQHTPPYSQPGGATIARQNQVLVTAGNEDVRYAHLAEYGTAEADAQPYFWPAYRLMRKRLASRIKRSISKAVKEAK